MAADGLCFGSSLRHSRAKEMAAFVARPSSLAFKLLEKSNSFCDGSGSLTDEKILFLLNVSLSS